MTPEEIVRALAATKRPIAEGIGCLYCALCGDSWRADDVAAIPSSHRPACPWRLAVEWVEANPRIAGVCTSEYCALPNGHPGLHVPLPVLWQEAGYVEGPWTPANLRGLPADVAARWRSVTPE